MPNHRMYFISPSKYSHECVNIVLFLNVWIFIYLYNRQGERDISCAALLPEMITIARDKLGQTQDLEVSTDLTLDAWSQALEPSCATFLGLWAESWIRNGTVRIHTAMIMGCLWHRPQHLPLNTEFHTWNSICKNLKIVLLQRVRASVLN